MLAHCASGAHADDDEPVELMRTLESMDDFDEQYDASESHVFVNRSLLFVLRPQQVQRREKVLRATRE